MGIAYAANIGGTGVITGNIAGSVFLQVILAIFSIKYRRYGFFTGHITDNIGGTEVFTDHIAVQGFLQVISALNFFLQVISAVQFFYRS